MASGAADGDDGINSLLEKLSLNEHSDIEEKLKNVECIFSWNPPKVTILDIIQRAELKLNDMKDTDEELNSWKLFILNAILCYEYAIKDVGNPSNAQVALDKLAECETVLNNDEPTEFFSMKAITHIIQATRAYLYFYSQMFDKAEETLYKIISIKDLDDKGLATLNGVQGAVLMEYGYEGMKKSVSYIEEAIRLDGNCGEWHFLLGRALGRMRRIDNRSGIPDKRELLELEKACSLTQCRVFRILLAQAYRDTARGVFYNNRDKYHVYKPYCNKLNQKALDLYRILLEEAGDNLPILMRCAQGLLKLPVPFRNIPLAEETILKCLKLSPENSFVNHVAGTYFSMLDDTEKAIKYLRLATHGGNYGAWMDLLSLQVKKQRNFDPVPELEKILDTFKTQEFWRDEILCNLGACHYFMKNNFRKALQYWGQVVESNIQCKHLKEFYCRLLKPPKEVKVTEILLDEISRELEEGTCSEEEKVYYAKLLSLYSEHDNEHVQFMARRYKKRFFPALKNIHECKGGKSDAVLTPTEGVQK